MMMDEFKTQLTEYAEAGKERQFTDEEYSKIEFVYTWHPAIKAVGGKRQIAIIWQEFGMGMINDMYPLAMEMETLFAKRADVRKDLDQVEKKIAEITNRY